MSLQVLRREVKLESKDIKKYKKQKNYCLMQLKGIMQLFKPFYQIIRVPDRILILLLSEIQYGKEKVY
jgi:hypothetical protein